jgi:hypothetical protein
MRRLRPLSEAECYVRLYGGFELNVTVVDRGPRLVRALGGLGGEDLRRLFEQRIDAREAEALEPEAA